MRLTKICSSAGESEFGEKNRQESYFPWRFFLDGSYSGYCC